MDPPEYSDPIVIPITLTIPDPRWQPQGGRWDHGSMRPPNYFANSRVKPVERAPETRTFSPAIERAMAILDQ